MLNVQPVTHCWVPLTVLTCDAQMSVKQRVVAEYASHLVNH